MTTGATTASGTVIEGYLELSKNSSSMWLMSSTMSFSSSMLISYSTTGLVRGGRSSKVRSTYSSSSSLLLDPTILSLLLLVVLRSYLLIKSDTSDDFASSIAKFNWLVLLLLGTAAEVIEAGPFSGELDIWFFISLAFWLTFCIIRAASLLSLSRSNKLTGYYFLCSMSFLSAETHLSRSYFRWWIRLGLTCCLVSRRFRYPFSKFSWYLSASSLIPSTSW